MESYWVALNKGKAGQAYNIGGRTVIKVGDFLDILKQKAKCKIISKLDINLLRPADVTLQIPDVSKFQRETGWMPKYSFEESAAFILEKCREIVAQNIGKCSK